MTRSGVFLLCVLLLAGLAAWLLWSGASHTDGRSASSSSSLPDGEAGRLEGTANEAPSGPTAPGASEGGETESSAPVGESPAIVRGSFADGDHAAAALGIVVVETGWRERPAMNVAAADVRFAGVAGERGGRRLDAACERRGAAFELRVPFAESAEVHGRRATLLLFLPGGAPRALARFRMPPPGATLDLGARTVPEARSLRGRVLDTKGRPVAEASVLLRPGGLVSWVEDESGRVRADAVSDARGRFVLPVDAADAALVVQHAGYRPLHLPWVRVPPGEIDLGTLVLESGRIVTGRVEVFPRLTVDATLLLEGLAMEPYQHHRCTPLTSDEEGRFRIGGLAPGIYRVSLRPRAGAPTLQGDEFEVADEDVDVGRVVFDLRAGVRFVDVADRLEAADVLGVTAWSRPQGDEAYFRLDGEVAAPGDEGFVLRGLPAGRSVGFHVRGPARLGGRTVVVPPVTVGGEGLVDVRLDFARPDGARVRLLLDDGQEPRPLPFATVRAINLTATPRATWDVATDASGGLDLPVAETERVQLTIRAAGSDDTLYWSGRPCDLPDGEIVIVQPCRDLRLVLLAVDGAPVSGVFLQALGSVRAESAPPAHVVRYAWTDDAGCATFARMPLGVEYRIGFQMGGAASLTNGFLPAAQIAFSEVTEAPLEIRLEGHRVRGRVLDPDGPVQAAPVQLLPLWEGAPYCQGCMYGFATAADGTFVVDGLPAGRYVLEQELANGAERRSEPFEVGPAQVDVDVRFLEPATRR